MTVKNYISAEPMISRGSATLLDPATWYVINPDGLLHACFLLRIINTSDVDVLVSFDGDMAQEFVASETTLVMPLQANAPKSYNCVALMAKGQKVYVTAEHPGIIGRVYLAGYYQD
jgi:hypothetical protein